MCGSPYVFRRGVYCRADSRRVLVRKLGRGWITVAFRKNSIRAKTEPGFQSLTTSVRRRAMTISPAAVEGPRDRRAAPGWRDRGRHRGAFQLGRAFGEGQASGNIVAADGFLVPLDRVERAQCLDARVDFPDRLSRDPVGARDRNGVGGWRQRGNRTTSAGRRVGDSNGGDATLRRRRVDRVRDQRRVRYVAADRVSHQGADEPDVLPEVVADRRRPRGFRRCQQAARTVDERGADVDRHRAAG